MTQAVAIVTPGFGLVANDTRLMQSCSSMDCETVATRQRVFLNDRGVKIHAFEGGWVTGGSYHSLGPWAVQYFLEGRRRDSEEIQRRLDDLWTDGAPQSPGPYTGVLLVQPDPDGFAIYLLEFEAKRLYRAVKRYCWCIPSGTEPGEDEQRATLDALVERFQQKHHEQPAASLSDAMRDTAQLFVESRAILGEDGTLSDQIMFGTIAPTPNGVEQRRLGPLPAARVAQFSDTELEAHCGRCIARA